MKKGSYNNIPFTILKNNDAVNAIEIKDSIFGPTNVNKGYGTLREYHEKTDYKDHGKPIYIGEENSAWFKLRVYHNTILTFDIVPLYPAHDYDFIFLSVLTINVLRISERVE